MGKLFIKLWILLLCTSYASWKIQSMVFDWSMQSVQSTMSSSPFLTTTAETLAWSMQDIPVTEWSKRFQHSGPKLTYPAEVLRVDEAVRKYPPLAENTERMMSGKNLWRSLGEGKPRLGIRRIAAPDLMLVIMLPPESTIQIFGVMRPTTFTWLVESVMYASAVLLWLSLFWRDLSKLIKASDKIGSGEITFGTVLRKSSALSPLANSLKRMTDRISALIDSHKSLTNAISHEFRTPITRLRFRHELALVAGSVAEKNRELQLMDAAIDQLDDLSTELLEYARLDRKEPQLDVGPIDVAPWLNELVAEARDLSAAAGNNVNIQLHSAVETVEGDHRYLSRAVANLLRNALRYAKQNVELSVEEVETTDGVKKYRLHVDDDGEGIPVAERENVFLPFTRLDESRDRQSGGSGIGLAIVRQSMRWHGGTAEISESKWGGARVSLNW